MTALQIKGQIDSMNPDDRFLAAAYLQHLGNQRDDGYRQELARRMDRMDSGKKFTQQQVERLHQALADEEL